MLYLNEWCVTVQIFYPVFTKILKTHLVHSVLNFFFVMNTLKAAVLLL